MGRDFAFASRLVVAAVIIMAINLQVSPVFAQGTNAPVAGASGGPVLPTTVSTSGAGKPATDAAGGAGKPVPAATDIKLQGLLDNLQQLDSNITAAVQAIINNKSATENDIANKEDLAVKLGTIGGLFSQIRTVEDFTNQLDKYFQSENGDTPPFQTDLDGVTSALGTLGLPQPWTSGEINSANRRLTWWRRDFNSATNNIVANDTNSILGDLDALGNDMSLIALQIGGVPPKQAGQFFPNVRTNELPYRFFISAGATFQAPYIVSYNQTTGAATLTNTGSTTVGTLDFNFIDRYVLRPNSQDMYYYGKSSGWHWVDQWQEEESKDTFLGWLHGTLGYSITHPDIDWNLGILFANGAPSSSGSNTTYSTATIAGSGNFWTDASVGLPLLRDKGDNLIQQVSAEIAGGATTDEKFMSVHPNFFVGGGYQASFLPFYESSTNNLAFIISRAGYGFIDMPDLTTNLDVRVSRSLPQWQRKWEPSIQTSFYFPMVGNIYFSLNVQACFLQNPTPWNITAGVTIPLDKVTDIFKQ